MRSSWASSPATRASMQSNRSKNTQPELALRRALHARGLRYRVCTRPMPELRQTADVVFPSVKMAVEVYGCFWHACPEHYRPPSSNAEFWAKKVEQNKQRDIANAQRLHSAGWTLEVVWEHEDPEVAAERIKARVQSRKTATSSDTAPVIL
jgi:DNA mismatch endonuclease (patch repair protein)